jgi:hypothetical protein
MPIANRRTLEEKVRHLKQTRDHLHAQEKRFGGERAASMRELARAEGVGDRSGAERASAKIEGLDGNLRRVRAALSANDEALDAARGALDEYIARTAASERARATQALFDAIPGTEEKFQALFAQVLPEIERVKELARVATQAYTEAERANGRAARTFAPHMDEVARRWPGFWNRFGALETLARFGGLPYMPAVREQPAPTGALARLENRR